jgi:hypothetical protein
MTTEELKELNNLKSTIDNCKDNIKQLNELIEAENKAIKDKTPKSFKFLVDDLTGYKIIIPRTTFEVLELIKSSYEFILKDTKEKFQNK